MFSSRIPFGGGKIEAQTRAVVCKPNDLRVKASAIVSDAKYQLPVPLRNIGTIDNQKDNAVCNLLFRNKIINGDGAYILASGDKPVVYSDLSENEPAEWLWTIPGYPEGTMTTRDASVLYTTPGLYDLPTLQVKTSNGTSTYSPGVKIKVGGESEISTIDCREWMSTYLLGAMPFENGAGYLGGTNTKDIVGYGNLFMMGTDEAYLNGVNVYLHHKPVKFKEGATLKLQVWMTALSENSIMLTYMPVEGALLKMEDIEDESDENVWIPVEGGAVARFRFEQPLSLYGKTVFFVSVEGFSNDPSTEDFCMLTDFIGKPLDEMQITNMLSHNSFARLNGENDYLRPINSYGGGVGSFAICPVISLPDVGAGTGVTTADNTGRLSAAFTSDGRLEVTAGGEGTIRVTDMAGKLITAIKVNEGKTVIDMPEAPKGIYIVSDSRGNSTKIIR